MLKPAARRRLSGLWGVWKQEPPPLPPDGAVSCVVTGSRAFYEGIGFVVLGPRAVRVDVLERLSAHLRAVTRAGAAPLPAQTTSWIGASVEELIGICRALGYDVFGEEHHQIKRPPRRRR